MELDELERLIKTRRSIRRWNQEPVSDESILNAIELAIWAPNGGNQQNWKFMVIRNRDIIVKMADTVQSKIDMIASWPEAIEFGETVDRWKLNSSFFRNAPVCIAMLMAKYESLADRILSLRIQKDTSVKEIMDARLLGNSGLQSLAAAICHFLLALHAQKLGAVWMTGPLVAKMEIERLLNVPKGMDFVALIPVGFPDEEPIQNRKPSSEVVEFRY